MAGSACRLALAVAGVSIAAAIHVGVGISAAVHSASPGERGADDPVAFPRTDDGAAEHVRISVLRAERPPSAAGAARSREASEAASDLAAVSGAYVPQEYRWSSGTVTWAYNPQGKPSGLNGEGDLVSAAAQTWNDAGAAFRFVDGGAGAGDTGACRGAADGRNTIGWATQPGSVLAITCVWYTSGAATEFDMAIDPAWPWTTTSDGVSVDFQTVVLHELGHALGLAHSEEGSAVMYSEYKWGTTLRDLTPDDRSAVAAIYGPAPAAVAAAAVTLELRAGANLVTWPGPDAAPEAALESIIESVTEVWHRSAETGAWTRFVPNGPAYLSNLTTLNAGVPYWIMVTRPGTLVIDQ